MENKFELKITPEWKNLDMIRDGVENFLLESDFSRSQVDALVMTSSELSENAIKYGDENYEVNISVDIYPREIIIEVKNKIKKNNDEELRKLDETIQWIRGFQNQYQAYMEKLKYISAKNLQNGESGLGLVRIAYEGQCILDFYVNEEDILAMSAVYKF